jgi:putative membrane protein
MRFLIRVLVTAAVAFGLSKLLHPHIQIADLTTAIVFALVLAILNMIIKPLLIILTLPITILTLGLFLLIINAIIIFMAAKVVNGIIVDGWLWAIIFSLLLSIITSAIMSSEKKDKDD